VTSKDNPALKRARKLLDRKERDLEGAMLVEGEKLIREALLAGFEVEAIFVRADCDSVGVALLAPEAKVIQLTDALYADISVLSSPRQMIAMVRKNITRTHVAKILATSWAPVSVLVLDGLQDPGNAGMAVRSAAAAGVDIIITTKGTVDLWSDKAIRASAGAVFRVKLLEGLEPQMLAAHLKKQGLKICVCSAEGQSCYDTDLKGGYAFVIGNEGHGVGTLLAKKADMTIGIPMAGGTESLNAAVAAALVLYEKSRQDSRR